MKFTKSILSGEGSFNKLGSLFDDYLQTSTQTIENTIQTETNSLINQTVDQINQTIPTIQNEPITITPSKIEINSEPPIGVTLDQALKNYSKIKVKSENGLIKLIKDKKYYIIGAVGIALVIYLLYNKKKGKN